jgi:paraquat-inducible protein A
MSDIDSYIACTECDLLVEKIGIAHGYRAQCPRCGHVLYRPVAACIDRMLALGVSCLLLFLPAVLMPIFHLSLLGDSRTVSVLSGVNMFHHSGYWAVAFGVLLFGILIPLFKIAALLYISICLKTKYPAPILTAVFHRYHYFRGWSMLEVFALGSMVSAIKLQDIGELEPGVGLYCFAGLLVMSILQFRFLDTSLIWQLIEKNKCGDEAAKSFNEHRYLPIKKLSMVGQTARQAGLLQCRICHKLIKAIRNEPLACPRCHEKNYSRIPNSLAQTWALLISSVILYIPANVLPVMTVSKIGSSKTDTIMSGILNLMDSGMLLIAIIVFVASIMVPLLKMLVLFILLLSVHFKWQLLALQRARLYRLTEYVGRWSMLDIFVIAILVALVTFGNLITIDTGPAATAFAGVVVLTMFAALRFDPRLIWDDIEKDETDN